MYNAACVPDGIPAINSAGDGGTSTENAGAVRIGTGNVVKSITVFGPCASASMLYCGTYAYLYACNNSTFMSGTMYRVGSMPNSSFGATMCIASFVATRGLVTPAAAGLPCVFHALLTVAFCVPA